MFINKKVAFYTLGCKLNFSESSTIGRQLTNIGFLKTDFTNKADLYVINTCSVTENANKECRRLIRKAKKISPPFIFEELVSIPEIFGSCMDQLPSFLIHLIFNSESLIILDFIKQASSLS
mgnify:CR=1 FL=1